MTKGMPVFVKIDEYKEVLDIIAVAKDKIQDAKSVMEHLTQLKDQEDAEIDAWNANIEDIEKKLQYIDNSLFEPNL